MKRLNRRGTRTRSVLLATGLLVLGITSFGVAASGDTLREGQRKRHDDPGDRDRLEHPVNHRSQGRIRHPPVHLSPSGGGALYGCRSRAGGSDANPPQNPCLRSNNLASGGTNTDSTLVVRRWPTTPTPRRRRAASTWRSRRSSRLPEVARAGVVTMSGGTVSSARDATVLSLPRELSVLCQTKLTPVVARGGRHGPIKARVADRRGTDAHALYGASAWQTSFGARLGVTTIGRQAVPRP